MNIFKRFWRWFKEWRKGPTLHAGNGAYVKLANYHTAHGKPSSVIHARVIRSAEPLPVADGL